MPMLEPNLPSIPCQYECGARVQIEADGTPVHIEGKAKYSFICHYPTARHYTEDCSADGCDECCDCFGCQFESDALQLPADHPAHGMKYDPELHGPMVIPQSSPEMMELTVAELAARLGQGGLGEPS